jgi:hypothetical protein
LYFRFFAPLQEVEKKPKIPKHTKLFYVHHSIISFSLKAFLFAQRDEKAREANEQGKMKHFGLARIGGKTFLLRFLVFYERKGR